MRDFSSFELDTNNEMDAPTEFLLPAGKVALTGANALDDRMERERENYLRPHQPAGLTTLRPLPFRI